MTSYRKEKRRSLRLLEKKAGGRTRSGARAAFAKLSPVRQKPSPAKPKPSPAKQKLSTAKPEKEEKLENDSSCNPCKAISTNPEISQAERDRLSKAQLKVVEIASNRAAKESNAALPLLVKRFKRLGFRQGELNDVRAYISSRAPIIIHFDPNRIFRGRLDVLGGFERDTHYRNRFETKMTGATSNASSRRAREGVLFQGGYDVITSPDCDRPKYGSINLFKTPAGTSASTFFGSCYLVLKDEARWRITFTSENIAGMKHSKEIPATCGHFVHLLERFSDAELRGLADASTGRGPSRSIPVGLEGVEDFWEAQIHGPVEFKRDIKELRFSRFYDTKLQARLQSWALNNGFPWNYLD